MKSFALTLIHQGCLESWKNLKFDNLGEKKNLNLRKKKLDQKSLKSPGKPRILSYF